MCGVLGVSMVAAATARNPNVVRRPPEPGFPHRFPPAGRKRASVWWPRIREPETVSPHAGAPPAEAVGRARRPHPCRKPESARREGRGAHRTRARRRRAAMSEERGKKHPKPRYNPGNPQRINQKSNTGSRPLSPRWTRPPNRNRSRRPYGTASWPCGRTCIRTIYGRITVTGRPRFSMWTRTSRTARA